MIDVATNRALIDAFIDSSSAVQALPETTTKMIRLTADPNWSMAEVLKYISRDAGLAARIMKAVNSAYYAPSNKITRLDSAIAFMGMRTVRELVISSSLGSIRSASPMGNFNSRDLWDHSLGVAILARELATHAGTIDPEEAFTAGILHDVGLLIASQSASKKCSQLFTAAETSDVPFTSLEQTLFGFTHPELGEALGEKWKFPEYVSAAIRWHHEPHQAPTTHADISLLLFIADNFCCEASVGFPLTCNHQQVTDPHLEAAHLTREIVADTAARLRVLLRLFL